MRTIKHCGRHKMGTVDHTEPDSESLMMLCKECNSCCPFPLSALAPTALINLTVGFPYICLVQWCTHCQFSPQNAQFNSYSVNHTSLGWESYFTPRRPLVMRLLFKAVRIYLDAVEVYSYVGTFRTIICWRW